MKNWIKLLICILLPFGIGALGGWATTASLGDWYMQLNKPDFNPPNAVFGPVWSGLYLLMAISSFLVVRGEYTRQVRAAITIYGLQLLLNLAWSFLFFYFHRVDLALIDILVLWICILVTIIRFYKVNKAAGLLLLPYLLWVSFASVLNLAIYRLN